MSVCWCGSLQLSEVQGYVQKWREQVVGVVSQMEKMEDAMREKVGNKEPFLNVLVFFLHSPNRHLFCV